MSKQNSHPEIRADLNYVFECDTYNAWVAWQNLYKDLPNVQVIFMPELQNAND